MFSWLRKVLGMPSNTQDLLQAYEKGKEASQALMQRIDAYLATRGGQFLKAFLPALEGRLHGLLTQESTAPELMAQQAWLEFLREIAQTEGELLTETPARLSDVFEAAKAIGIRPQ